MAEQRLVRGILIVHEVLVRIRDDGRAGTAFEHEGAGNKRHISVFYFL